MSAPFMQLYVADYLGDTQHLTTEQHGAYLLLLMTMWRQGGTLPDEPKMLARIARVSARRWHLIADEVMAFFDLEDGHITQKRLVEEYQKAVSKSEKRSISGKLGVEAKSLKTKKQASANASGLLQHSSEPEPEDKKEAPDGASKKARQGSRIGDFEPSIQVAIDLGLSPERARLQAESFKDFWKAKAGANATKLDWPATWRNWVRDKVDKQPSAYQKTAPSRPKSVGHRMADKMLGRAAPQPEEPDAWRTIDGFASHH